MGNIFKAYYSSTIGTIEICGNEDGITSIIFIEGGEFTENVPDVLRSAYSQIDEYFNGVRLKFDLKLALEGTEFQKKVWAELLNIPCGETLTYKDIAKRIGNPDGVRAVGNANGKNPISIVVPCHRVIGSSGKLTGYSGGLEKKAWLLKHEKDMMKNA